MPKSGVYGKDSKKAKPHFKKGEASKDTPINTSDKGSHKLDRDSLGTLSLLKCPCPPGTQKNSYGLASSQSWTAQKRLDRLFNCLFETALEYANRCEGQMTMCSSALNLHAGLIFGIPCWPQDKNCIQSAKRRMRDWMYFCSGFCPSV